MGEAGGGTRGSPRSVPGQTPCKESCRAELDTLPTPRTVPPTRHTPAPRNPRDPQPQNPPSLRSATPSPCPGPSPSPLRANPGPTAPAEAGALITAPAGSAAALLPAQRLQTHSSTDAFCCRQRLCGGREKNPLFPPKRQDPERGKGSRGSTHRRLHPAMSQHPAGWEPEEVAEAEVRVVMAIAAVWDGAERPGPQDPAPGPAPRGAEGGPGSGLGGESSSGPCGAAAPLGLLPVSAARIFLNPPKIVWECGSPCEPQGWGEWGG